MPSGFNVSEYFNGNELEIDIYNMEEMEYEKGGNGITIYLIIKNKTNKSINIEVNETYVINSNRVQREKDYYLTGYQLTETAIASKASKIRGDIYLYSNIDRFQKGWIFFASVTDKTNGKEYNINYRLNSLSDWEIISCDIIDVPKEISSDEKRRELLNNLERIEAFEERMGVRLENISLTYSDSNLLTLYFDVYELEPDSIKETFKFNAVLYDNENQIIKKGTQYLIAKDFFGFNSFEISLGFYKIEELNRIQKIRLFISK